MSNFVPPDSVAGRILPWLSLLGSGSDSINGKLLTHGGKRLPIHIGSSIFRKFVCQEGCYVCCSVLSLSLDFIPMESAWRDHPRQDLFSPRWVEVNGKKFEVMSNHSKRSYRNEPARQDDPSELSRMCTFLAPVRSGNPGCSLWATGSPLSCASAYNMRVSEHPSRVLITKQGMARAWRYSPSPECEFLEVPIEEADVETNISLFLRFIDWAEYFEMTESVKRIQSIVASLESALRDKRAVPIVIP